MPRGRLTERYVRRVAVKWLASHYQQKQDVQVALRKEEVVISSKSKFGRGRADGLIVACLSDGTIHTASLEAKSSTTLFNISPSYKDAKWLAHAVLAGVIGLILARFMGRSIGGRFCAWVFPVLVFMLVGFVYLVLTLDYSLYRPIDVIAQVKDYPANEHWIAISTDAYNQLGTEGQETLRKDCRKEGIGLMRVSAGQKVILLEVPKVQSSPRGHGDFLTCYAKEESIRKELREKLEERQDRIVA